MNLHKFYFDGITRAREKRERYCQAMFNHLAEVRPDLSEMVRGTIKDPFYLETPNHPTWDRFVHFIETNWYSYQCGCSWVDEYGQETPDTNPAIGLAVCHDPRTFGEKGSIPFLICAEHAKKKPAFWKVNPLPNQNKEEWDWQVSYDDWYFQIIPDAVTASIKEHYPNLFDDIIKRLMWKGDHFSFTLDGIYIGVEKDGYIHS